MSEVAKNTLQYIVDQTSPEDRESWIERLIISEQSREAYWQDTQTTNINLLAEMCGHDNGEVERMRRKVVARMKLEEELFRATLEHKDKALV